jgi:hypothetical protein
MGFGLKEKNAILQPPTQRPWIAIVKGRGPWAVGDAVFDVLFKKSRKERKNRKDRQAGRQAKR